MTVLSPALSDTLAIEDISTYTAVAAESFLALDIEQLGPNGFRGSIQLGRADRVRAALISATPHTVTRTHHHIDADQINGFKVSVMLSGFSVLIQDDREAILAPGDLAIYHTARPYSMAYEHDIRMLVLMFPEQLASVAASALNR